MQWVTNIFSKAGVFGTFITAMGCAACFPALGALAATLGLGFLAQYEGLYINTLLPLFASIALGSSVISFYRHRCWKRLFLGFTGPVMVLLTLYPLWAYAWSTYLFYAGLFIMLAAAIWDIVAPADRYCATSK